MTDDTKRRKKLLYRANHRGIKEMDILLGGYASRHIETLDGAALDAFEALLGENDRDLLAWFTGERKPPPAFDTAVFRAIGTHRPAKTG